MMLKCNQHALHRIWRKLPIVKSGWPMRHIQEGLFRWLMQACSKSITEALELLQSCTKPSDLIFHGETVMTLQRVTWRTLFGPESSLNTSHVCRLSSNIVLWDLRDCRTEWRSSYIGLLPMVLIRNFYNHCMASRTPSLPINEYTIYSTAKDFDYFRMIKQFQFLIVNAIYINVLILLY